MEKWQEYTLRANTEFGLEYYGNAILLHHQALDSARFEFEMTAKLSPDRAISKVVISHFNLADCHIALGDIERAGEFYLAAQNFLLERLRGEVAEVWVDALNHAMSHVHFIWLEFLKKYRLDISYGHMLRYHERTLVFNQLEAQHAVCH